MLILFKPLYSTQKLQRYPEWLLRMIVHGYEYKQSGANYQQVINNDFGFFATKVRILLQKGICVLTL